MKNYKMAIIDFDGTIVSSMDYMDDMLRGLLHNYGIQANDDMLQEIKPKGFINGSSYIKTKYNVDASVEEIVGYMRKELSKVYTDIIPLKDDVMDFVKLLIEQGIKVCLATANQKDFVQAAVKRTGLEQHLDYLVTTDDVGSTKDSPMIFLHCAEKFHLVPQDCMVFEDSLIACEVAKKAGFFVVGVKDKTNMGKEQAAMEKICDLMIDNFSQAIKKI